MTHPTDDALNSAWNDIVSGKDAGWVSEAETTDASLLQAMHATADTVLPDSAFRDQLWADLSRRPVISAPAPAAAPSLPTSFANRSGAPTMTPRLAPASRRWSPPIATIAAALVIALVGYGALSLSGANPSGINLNLNEVPNASAQGQGMAQSDNPVVGTWAIWANAFSDTNSVSTLMHFEASGTVVADIAGLYQGTGTWSVDPEGRINYQYTAFPPLDQVEDQYQAGDLAFPNFFELQGNFRISDDGLTWIDEHQSGTTIGINQFGQTFRLIHNDERLAGAGPGIVFRGPERVDDLVARSRDATDQERDWLENGGHQADDTTGFDVNAPPPSGNSDQVTVTPLPTYIVSTPTSAPLLVPTIQPTMASTTARPEAPTPTMSP